jgi:hypothetical protein
LGEINLTKLCQKPIGKCTLYCGINALFLILKYMCAYSKHLSVISGLIRNCWNDEREGADYVLSLSNQKNDSKGSRTVDFVSSFVFLTDFEIRNLQFLWLFRISIQNRQFANPSNQFFSSKGCKHNPIPKERSLFWMISLRYVS